LFRSASVDQSAPDECLAVMIRHLPVLVYKRCSGVVFGVLETTFSENFRDTRTALQIARIHLSPIDLIRGALAISLVRVYDFLKLSRACRVLFGMLGTRGKFSIGRLISHFGQMVQKTFFADFDLEP